MWIVEEILGRGREQNRSILNVCEDFKGEHNTEITLLDSFLYGLLVFELDCSLLNALIDAGEFGDYGRD